MAEKRPLIASLAFCAVAGVWLSSDVVAVPMPVAPNILFAIAAPLALGYFARTPWAAVALLFPVFFPLAAPGAVPEDPDIPRYPELLSAIAVVLASPAALLTLLGAWVARRARPTESSEAAE